MNLSTHRAHKCWLLIAAVVVGSFAPVLTLGSMLSTAEPARWTLDLLSWPLDGAQSYRDPSIRFLSALTGGFLLGWGVLIWCLRRWAYDAAPEAVRKSVVVSLVAWFLLDSTGSALAGAPSNILFNALVFVTAVGPLWRRARGT